MLLGAALRAWAREGGPSGPGRRRRGWVPLEPMPSTIRLDAAAASPVRAPLKGRRAESRRRARDVKESSAETPRVFLTAAASSLKSPTVTTFPKHEAWRSTLFPTPPYADVPEQPRDVATHI